MVESYTDSTAPFKFQLGMMELASPSLKTGSKDFPSHPSKSPNTKFKFFWIGIVLRQKQLRTHLTLGSGFLPVST